MLKRIDTAVILAAGRGTRLQPMTHDIPKGFVKVGDETLIERSIRILKTNGIKTIFIGTGHLSELYVELAKSLGFVTFKNPDFATTGSFHTLMCAEKLITDDFLLLESDLLYHEDAISALVEHVEENIILCSGFTNSGDEVYVELANGLLRNLSKNKNELGHLNGELVGIWKISQSLYKELVAQNSLKESARSIDYEVAIAQSEFPVHALKIENLAWCEIDNQAHLERASKHIYPRLT